MALAISLYNRSVTKDHRALWSYIDELPPGTPKFEFTKLSILQQKLQSLLDSQDQKTSSNYIIFTNVSDGAIGKILDDESLIHHWRPSVEHEARVVILKMASGAHEEAVGRFSRLFEYNLLFMGLHRSLAPLL